MTDAPALGRGTLLDFHGPLSADRAARLVRDLAGDPRRSPAGVLPQSVLDLGCGWGELLLRLVAALPGAYGTGVDTHSPDLERGRAAAAERGLSDRVTFVDGEAAALTGPADLVLSIGAYQAFGGIPEALTELRSRVAPGGRLLFGAEFWEQTPPPERLANMWDDMTLDSCLYLPQLVDAAVAAGFRPLGVEVASRAEWDEFESGLAAQSELWLLAHPGHAEAGELRAKLDTQRDIWLRGHQGYLGFAYLTLGVPV